MTLADASILLCNLVSKHSVFVKCGPSRRTIHELHIKKRLNLYINSFLKWDFFHILTNMKFPLLFTIFLIFVFSKCAYCTLFGICL